MNETHCKLLFVCLGIGISSVHYNRFLSPNGHHYLRKANETIQVVGCEISAHRAEAVRVDTPFRDVGRYPLAEVKYVINYTTVSDNQWAIVQSSRDLRDSNNLFHWIVRVLILLPLVISFHLWLHSF